MYAGRSSSALGEIVKTSTQTSTAATLTSNPLPPVASFRIYAQDIVFTVTIAPGAGNTTGESVTLYDGATSLGCYPECLWNSYLQLRPKYRAYTTERLAYDQRGLSG